MDHEVIDQIDHENRVVIDPPQQQFPSHVQAYDILRRIGELEDAKQSICIEIDECMGQLQAIAAHIDEDSLLNRMLSAVFPKVVKPAAKRKAATRKKKR
jgi:hypothetical protein